MTSTQLQKTTQAEDAELLAEVEKLAWRLTAGDPPGLPPRPDPDVTAGPAGSSLWCTESPSNAIRRARACGAFTRPNAE